MVRLTPPGRVRSRHPASAAPLMPSGEIRPAEPGLRVPQATQDMQWCSLTIPMPKVQVRCCPPREAPRGGLPYPALILYVTHISTSQYKNITTI
nr:MAG TPA: hypothetical protein [Caudoviricetes sp.]